MKKNSNKSSKQFKKNTIAGLLTALIIVIVVNIISSFLFYRIDLTKDKRHSLSPATIEMLKNQGPRLYPCLSERQRPACQLRTVRQTGGANVAGFQKLF